MLYHAMLAVINIKQCLHMSRTNIHSSYAVIWMQVTIISEEGFHVMQTWLKLLPVSILTAQADNPHMVCC